MQPVLVRINLQNSSFKRKKIHKLAKALTYARQDVEFLIDLFVHSSCHNLHFGESIGHRVYPWHNHISLRYLSYKNIYVQVYTHRCIKHVSFCIMYNLYALLIYRFPNIALQATSISS